MRALAFLALALATPALADAPRFIPHEGRLLRADGSPERASVSLIFALYAAAAGGPVLWSESHAVTPSAGGYYALLLGKSVPLPAFAQPYWLGITVQGEAELAPRMQLGSAPYALRAASAADADKLGGHASTEVPFLVGGRISAAALPANVPLLEADGRYIARRFAATGFGEDGIDNGQVTGRTVGFTKLRGDTALRITYSDAWRVIATQNSGNAHVCRWRVLINGLECTNPGPVNQIIHAWENNGYEDYHRHGTIVALCKGLAAGDKTLTVHVTNNVYSYPTSTDCYTGWSGDYTQWYLEAEEVVVP